MAGSGMAACATEVELHGHRGARGIAPENTLVGFREAIRLGVDWIEIDIGMSREGVLIVHHDRALNTSIARKGGSWIETPIPLFELDAREIRSFDVGRIKPGSGYANRYPYQKPVDGTAIPTLADMLEMPEMQAHPEISLNIEIKTSPLAPNETAAPERIVKALVALLDTYGYRKRARIQSFDWRNLKHLRDFAPDLPLSFLTAELPDLDNLQRAQPAPSPWLGGANLEAFGGSVPRLISHMGGKYWAPFYRDISSGDVVTAHGEGLKVIVWTVNDADDMHTALMMGVDGIITDYPDIGRDVIDRHLKQH
jgi:glycerophosphoryl diester phosphodiesterase